MVRGESSAASGGSAFALRAAILQVSSLFSSRRSVQTVRAAQPVTLQPASTGAELDRSLLKGIAWTSLVTWLSQLLSWGSTLVVVHYLVPSDYGLIGMALLYLGFAQMASELGVGAAVVQFHKLTDDQLRQFNSVAILAGFACVLISFAAATPLGHFFREPRLPVIILVMSTNFIVSAFKVVPQGLMERKLQFRKLALFEGTKSILAATANLTMAMSGFGYWTLALGPLIGATVYAILVVAQNPVGFRLPRLATIKEPFAFSSHMLVSRFAWYGFSNADFAVISKALGSTALGAYTIGWTLSGMAVEKITALVGRVTPAFFSAVQNDRAALRRYLLLVTEGLALVTFPVCIGLALIAEDIVLLAMGERWTPAIVPMQLLAIVATFRSIQPLIPQVLVALRQSRRNMNNTLLTVLVLPLGFYVASRWGIGGVALAWLIMYPLLAAPLFARTFRMIGLPVSKYLGALWPGTSSCVIMAGAVTLIGSAFPNGSSYMLLLTKILVGAVSYTGSLLLFHRQRVLGLHDVLRLLRTGARPAAPQPNPAVTENPVQPVNTEVALQPIGAV
jgi:teichuronic acid exporter